MPNRVVREDILNSERVEKLSYAAEVFYRRLMSMLDDYGCGDGRVSIMRSTLYPLRLEKVSESDLSKWIAECEKADLVRRYQHQGKPYIWLLNFNQTVRQKRRKHPPPPASMLADASRCKQMQADESLNETNPIQSETNHLPRFNADDYYQSGEQAFTEIQKDEQFIERLLMLVRGNGFQACTAVQVMQAVKKFIVINQAKPDFTTKGKAAIKEHLVNWMNKKDDF